MASVGKASLALDGVEIAEGRKIGVGSVGEMMKQRAEWRSERISVGGGGGVKKEGAEKATMLQPTGPIRRPVQLGGRRGGKGGLGFKRGGGVVGPERVTTESHEKQAEGVMDVDKKEGKLKSNDDFKAMFLKPSESKAEAD